MEHTVSGSPYGRKTFCLIPESVDDVSAAGIPVAYLTAQMALTLVVFRQAKPCWRRRSEDRLATRLTQLAGALGAKHAMSSTTNHRKPTGEALGFNEVIDTSLEEAG